LVYAAFEDGELFTVNCIKSYKAAMIEAEKKGVNVKALLISNPHNPLGRCYSRATLIALMRSCEQRNIHLVSDEADALSVFETENHEAETFSSVLSVDPRNLVRTDSIHVLYSLPKVKVDASTRGRAFC
jgi:aspartate/methionine/tyrosine aminotransferase